MLFREVDNATWMEEGSSGQGNLAGGNTEQYFKDTNMPDGDACRPDGTLKDASEMLFLNSPSEAPGNLPEPRKDDYFFLNLKRGLPGNDSDDEQSSLASDSNDSVEGVGPRSKEWRKVSIPNTPDQ
jgi:hypothetical protein